MSLDSKYPAYFVDLTAAAVCAGALLVCAWFVFVRGDEVRAELAELRATIADGRRDLVSMNSIRDHQKDLLRTNQEELSRRGHLPDQTPVEEYFQNLSALAQRSGLAVVRHQPLLPRSYPGLLERRYAYEVTGTFDSLMQFLRGVEVSDYWADIGFLRIQQSDAPGNDDKRRTAILTMSVFSTSATAPNEKSTGG